MLYCVQVLDEIGRSLNFSYGAAVLDLVREGRVTMGAALAGLSFSSALAARPHCRPRPVSRAALLTAPSAWGRSSASRWSPRAMQTGRDSACVESQLVYKAVAQHGALGHCSLGHS